MPALSSIISFIFLVLIILYAAVLFKSRLNPKVIKYSAIAILISGTALYMAAFHLEGYTESISTIFFRSLILSVKMFVYDNSDLCELTSVQHYPYFLDVYFFIFYAAMITSLSAILMMFSKRAMTFFMLLFKRRNFDHVFIGVNKRSEIIAGGIKDESIAFIEFPSDKDENEMSVTRILKGMSSDDAKNSAARHHHTVMLRAKRRFQQENVEDNVFASIGLERLKKFIGPDTAFYILSENAERNLNELMCLLGDKDLSRNTIHVCVSREGVARYYKTILKRSGAHFIYPSSLAVVELMKTPSCHPASAMKPLLLEDGSVSGMVSGDFNAMVVGFGETGQAVAKFLYEYSAAIGADGKPLPINIIATDSRIDALKGHFIFDNPEIAQTDSIRYESNGTESSLFWENLEARLDGLNYIAISMGDDASNLDLACTIFMYALKKRKGGLDNFRIVVRKRRTLSHEKELVDKLNEKAGREVIVCYGEYEKIFTPEMIVSKERNGINQGATSLASVIAESYKAVSGKQLDLSTESESFHVKNRARMELHQLISRSNNLPTLSVMTAGKSEVSPDVLENLAKREHLRYSRYLTAHGYYYSAEDDDVYKTNHQICPWESLTEEDRQYHRDMVLSQLALIR